MSNKPSDFPSELVTPVANIQSSLKNLNNILDHHFLYFDVLVNCFLHNVQSVVDFVQEFLIFWIFCFCKMQLSNIYLSYKIRICSHKKLFVLKIIFFRCYLFRSSTVWHETDFHIQQGQCMITSFFSRKEKCTYTQTHTLQIITPYGTFIDKFRFSKISCMEV